MFEFPVPKIARLAKMTLWRQPGSQEPPNSLNYPKIQKFSLFNLLKISSNNQCGYIIFMPH